MKVNYIVIGIIFIGSFVLIVCASFRILLVEGDSMKPTINKGDYVLVLKKEIINLAVKENDIIIVNREVDNKIYVKRIFSVENDFLSIDDKSLNNGKYTVPQDPIYYANYTNDSLCKSYLKFLFRNIETHNDKITSNSNFGNCLARTPENHFFVVGDNYNNSIDSRLWGFINKDQIIGKVIAIF